MKIHRNLKLDFKQVLKKSKLPEKHRNSAILLLVNTWYNSVDQYSFTDNADNWKMLTGVSSEDWSVIAYKFKECNNLLEKYQDKIIVIPLRNLKEKLERISVNNAKYMNKKWKKDIHSNDFYEEKVTIEQKSKNITPSEIITPLEVITRSEVIASKEKTGNLIVEPKIINENIDNMSKKIPLSSLSPIPPISSISISLRNIIYNNNININIYILLHDFGIPDSKIEEIFNLCPTITEEYLKEKIEIARLHKNRENVLFRAITTNFKEERETEEPEDCEVLPAKISIAEFNKLSENDKQEYKQVSKIIQQKPTYKFSYSGDFQNIINAKLSEYDMIKLDSGKVKSISLEEFNNLSAKAKNLFSKICSAPITDIFYILNT